MAKKIKAIQCPKCGSNDKRETKPDYFVCNNCNTEYYLDNDDITINHNINYNNTDTPIQGKPVDTKRLGAIIGFAVVLLLLITVVPLLFKSSHNSVPDITLKKTSWTNATKSFFVNDKEEPILVIAGTRNNSEKAYAGFINMQTGKEVKLQTVSLGGEKAFEDFKIQHFSNGDVYAIGNKVKIFKVDKVSYALTDVSASMLAKHPEMSSGIANAEFIFRPDGEGFKMINNEGKSYFYYPLNGELYTIKEKQASADMLDIKEPGEKLVTAYVFTSKSSQFPEEPLQLIQYTKKENKGGPDYIPWLEWGTKHAGGVAEKTIIKFGKETVRSWKDLTPGHNYFDPELLYFDKDFVIYTAASTPAQNAPKILQCVTVSSGAVKWTMPLDDESVESVVKCKNGFLIGRNRSALYISDEGKLLRKYATI